MNTIKLQLVKTVSKLMVAFVPDNATGHNLYEHQHHKLTNLLPIRILMESHLIEPYSYTTRSEKSQIANIYMQISLISYLNLPKSTQS